MANTTFTRAFMEANCGCYKDAQTGALAKLYACSFMNDGDSISLEAIINSEIALKDKFWFVCNKVFDKRQAQEFALGCASIVLEVFEAKYPDDKRPRLALEAAADFLDGKIDADAIYAARSAYAAARSAYAAAYAATADAAAVAAAAARSAYAATVAAYADAYAATAAARSAYADAYADDAATAAARSAYADDVTLSIALTDYLLGTLIIENLIEE